MSFALSIIIYITASLLFIVLYCLNPEDYVRKVLWYTQNPSTLRTVFIMVCIMGGILAVIAVFEFNLLFYHIWLIQNNLTTYEHMSLKKREKVQKSSEEGVSLKHIGFN